MIKQICFNGLRQLSVNVVSEEQALQPNEIRVEGICSIMSTGTENIVYNRLFESGSHWDNWVKYPFYPGYALIGNISELGSEVKHYHLGQRVALRKGHSTSVVVPAESAIPLPENIDAEKAAWFALSKITYVGATVADYKMGDQVLIVGGGPIGQLSLRWALACGTKKVVMMDPLQERLHFATLGGAHAVISKPLAEAKEEILEVFGGVLPEVVIDSTGSAAVLPLCLPLCKDQGKVIILGDTGTPTLQHLTSDVMVRGVKVLGAHDGYIRDNAAPSQLFWQMIQDKRINMDGMNTHHFDIDQAQLAYDVVNQERNKTMGVIFNLSKVPL